jgi:hypothetical protein
LTKTEDEETIIINRPDGSTYPQEISVLTSGATPDLGNVKVPGRRGRRYDGHDPGRSGETSGGRNRAIAPLAGTS